MRANMSSMSDQFGAKNDARSKGDFDLAALLDVENIEAFFHDYWEKGPMVLHRNKPNYYDGLFSIRDIDSVLCLKRFKHGEVGFLFPDQPDPVPVPLLDSGLADFVELQTAYRKGASVLLYACEGFCEPIAKLCRSMTQLFRGPVTIGAFLSPPGIHSSAPHYDKGDAFIIQLEGTKKWRIYEQTVPHPLPDPELSVLVDPDKLPTLLHDVEIGPGDLLYVPRGFVHEAQTTDSPSLHLTVLLRAYCWSDLLLKALAVVTQRQVALRRAIPVGLLRGDMPSNADRDQFRAMLQLLAKDANLDEGLDEVNAMFMRTLRAIPDDRLNQIQKLNTMTLDSRLRKTHGVLCQISHGENDVSISFPQNAVRAPLSISPTLHFIESHDTFLVRDFPGLRDEGKLTLARRLVTEGLLHFVDC